MNLLKMDMIKLIKKHRTGDDPFQLVVSDELISGLLSKEFYVPVITGADKGLRIFPFSELVIMYQFPECRITSFMQGYPRLFSQIEFYKQQPAATT